MSDIRMTPEEMANEVKRLVEQLQGKHSINYM